MSYFDLPRAHFSGQFFCDPSTINNEQANYDSANFDVSKLALWWNPKGTGVFKFVDCKVNSVRMPNGELVTDASADPIIGTGMSVVENPFAGKIVDLDPQQQQVSELWGLQMLLGSQTSEYVVGSFAPAAFTQLAPRAFGAAGGSSPLGGVYQSTLSNLAWQNQANSPYLDSLKQITGQRLSIKMVVDLHNNAPQVYLATDDSLGNLTTAYGVPADVVGKLTTLKDYWQYTPGEFPSMPKGVPGIPTQVYLDYLLGQLLTPQEVQQYSADIAKGLAQTYTPAVADMPFTTGRVIGTISPCADDEPTYAAAFRMLQSQSTRHDSNPIGFTPFSFNSNTNRLTVDMGNSLPTTVDSNTKIITGQVDQSLYGCGLTLGYYKTDPSTDFTAIKALPVMDNSVLEQTAGMVEIDLPADLEIDPGSTAMAIQTAESTPHYVFEQPQGYYLRADKFVFRMNPASDDPLRGASANVDVCVYKFGAPLDDSNSVQIQMSKYGENGFGSHPTTCKPQDAFNIAPLNPATATTDANGQASFILTATDPGNPRVYLDGQLYGASYGISPAPDNYLAAGNESSLSVQVYQEQSYTDNPTWNADVSTVLAQYGWLYPVMGRFDLGNYDSVKKYAAPIRQVLEAAYGDPNYMPVTRDLSASRLAMILKWFDNGMAK